MEEAEEEVEVGEELGEELGEEAGDVADDAARAHAALADASAAAPARPPKLVHQRYRRLRIDLLACKYDAVWRAAREMGWTPLEPDEADSDEWHVFWTDNSVSQERVMRMRPMQRINHFPGMLELARKAGTARNLNRMLKAFPHEYKIFPATWMLPADLVDFKAQFNGRKNKTFIVKPSRGCQGKDILLTRSMEGINLHENYIAQRYLHRPYLLDGFKFDLRLYVLITCVEPLRVYVYREGMVRLCTHKYGPVKANNLEDQCMHLTNYAINKQDEGYTPAASEADERAHKRLLSTVLERLEGCGENTAALSYAIDDVIVKSIIAVQPHLERTYYSCQQRTVRARARAARRARARDRRASERHAGKRAPSARARSSADAVGACARVRTPRGAARRRRTPARRASSSSAWTCSSTTGSSRTCSRSTTRPRSPWTRHWTTRSSRACSRTRWPWPPSRATRCGCCAGWARGAWSRRRCRGCARCARRTRTSASAGPTSRASTLTAPRRRRASSHPATTNICGWRASCTR